FRSYGAQGVLKKHPFCGAFLVFWGFKFLSMNKGEARNSLARAVFFNRLGEIRDRSFEQQRYRASGLNLVTAAIVLWNTVYLERATQGLVEAGKPVDGELLQFLSPLGWEHINLTGDYVWRQSRRLEDGKFRPLRMPGKP
ncbi:Tn3 family transposase, partial [Escherichia coli]|uniref:Tn3 family transposase n=2 Tax=Escherichia coli TaxID=562 RepID=UPI001F36CD84